MEPFKIIVYFKINCCSSDGGPGDFVSEFSCPEPSVVRKHFSQFELTGMIQPSSMKQTLNIIR